MRKGLLGILLLFVALPLAADDAAELRALLDTFLAGAGRNDAAVHDRFWADDLIYTGSSGRRIGKADIMKDVRSAPAHKPGDPTAVFSAEDVRIQQYGDMAIVAFRLVSTTSGGDRTTVSKYLNSGTFLKRDGKWQVVNWQATKVPRPDDESKADVAAAEATFHQALAARDVKKIESLTDETFVWMRSTGEQMTRAQLLEAAGSGKSSKYAPGSGKTVVNVYGDTGVVRGAAETLTFVYKGGAWKAVALHSWRTR
jgi:uncharacterized protein (TIGR02246 family)